MVAVNPKGADGCIRVSGDEISWLSQGMGDLAGYGEVTHRVELDAIDDSTPAGRLYKALEQHQRDRYDREAYSKIGSPDYIDLPVADRPTILDGFKAVITWAETTVTEVDGQKFEFKNGKYWQQAGRPVCERAVQQLEGV